MRRYNEEIEGGLAEKKKIGGERMRSGIRSELEIRRGNKLGDRETEGG